jgi:phage terminase large subunit-like protein
MAPSPVETAYNAGYKGLLAFAELIGEALEPHEKRIARAHFGEEREVYGILSRGNLKTTLAAKVGLHHLLTVEAAAVTLGAASRDQARICYERMRGFAQHPALEDDVVIRHLELRHEEESGQLRLLRVVPSDGPRVHGLSSTLYIGDEIWAWKGDDLLEAMLTGLVKNPEARFLGISTAAARLDTALGRTRARAMAGKVTRRGALIDATAPGLRWLEWSLPEDRELDDFRAIKACNPASYITKASLREQATRVTPAAFAQFHACRWGVGEGGAWLPDGAWSTCAGETHFEDGERIWCGIDVGGSQADTAVCWVNENLDVGVKIFSGDEGVLRAKDLIERLAERFTIAEVAYDPWRAKQIALELEARRVRCVEFPQTAARMHPASERLYRAIIEGRLTHLDDPALNRHVAAAVAKSSPRGWQLAKAPGGGNIDGAIALAMCVDRASEPPPPPTKFLGWL